MAGGFLAVLAQGGYASSLLSNPGFESDPSGQTATINGWNSYGGNAFSETSPTIAHSGTNYFKVYQQFVNYVNYTGIYQDYISGAGAIYQADGWAYMIDTDKLVGQNAGWIEVTFRDANANILALYRSAVITTNDIARGRFPINTWNDLPVTNQYNPSTLVITNSVSRLVAPAGTYFVRYQIVLQGDASYSNGSMYFDDLNLVQIGGAPYGNWNIVWNDEFNGTTNNPNVWTYDLGNSGWGNNELEYYTSRTNNVRTAGGMLHIAAQRESYNGASYTSARMKSQGLFSFQYGRLEWRAKLPVGTGTWPALWLLGTNINTIGWPNCGEIDVVENNGNNPGQEQGSLHWGGDSTAFYNFLNGDSVTNFHTYTLDWSPTAFLFYVDGHLYQTQTSWTSPAGTYPFPFNQPFFLIMNLAIGGSYLGNPSQATINAGTVFPAEMLVDYVRIYSQTTPLQLSISPTNANLLLTWPGNIVCHLQVQTNSLGNNWVDTVTPTNQLQVNPSNKAAFYRLASP